MLKMLEHNGQTADYDRYCFSQLSNLESCTISIRFPKKGLYILAVFGGSLSNDASDRQAQLQPIYYGLIVAEDESAITKPFPTTYALWTSSCHSLQVGLDETYFKRDQESTLKVGSFY